MDMLSTIRGSLLEGFYPSGWDLERIDACCALPPEDKVKPADFWDKDFTPCACANVYDFDAMLGHEIALQIRLAKEEGRKLALILPAGPMGMYKWTAYFLTQWGVACEHVYGFNMDEWSDAEGGTLPPDDPRAFENAMRTAFYEPLGALTVPADQRFFAHRDSLPRYAERIAALRAEGAKLITVYGIGRMCHIAFWEPHFAQEFSSEAEWRKQTHRLAAQLHPLTIEQNAITSFKSRSTAIPCRANTVGPGLFLDSDYMIGGCDGALARGMQWQGASLAMTLQYGPDMWVPSSFIPTRPGKLFYLKELLGPLGADIN